MSDAPPLVTSRYLDADDPDTPCAGCGDAIRAFRDECLTWRGRNWHTGCLTQYLALVVDHMREADIVQAEMSIEYERQQPARG